MALDPTPRSDYEHWNEDRDRVWFEEVGRFGSNEDPPDPDEEFDYYTEPYLDEEEGN